MNIFKVLEEEIYNALDLLKQSGAIPTEIVMGPISVEPPRDPMHGDVATNAALVLAGQANCKPRDLAKLLVPELKQIRDVISVDIAGPGFLNFRLQNDYWRRLLLEVLDAGSEYGRNELGAGRKVIVEFVSANPTGPLHVGHARGAVFGDVLSRLLKFSGFDVTREYYWNDAGAQVDKLAAAVYWRYLQNLDGDTSTAAAYEPVEEVGYTGDYLVDVGTALAEAEGDKWRDVPEKGWLPDIRAVSVDAMKALIRDDLSALGVEFDSEVSESRLVAEAKVDAAVEALELRGLIYRGQLEPPKGRVDDWEAREQTLFRSTQFGDQVDRPLQKSDGTWTYFATDIAYHLDKFKRGHREMINVWGADHGGYVSRVKAAVEALTDGVANLDVRLCQMVRLFDGGKPVKMSKRSGSFITVRDLIEAMDERVGSRLGKDVVRFIMLTRKNDAPLDFDFAKATEQSRDNPVFYVQYANARICSVRRRVKGDGALNKRADISDLARLEQPDELALIRLLADWPRQVETAAGSCEPHRLAFYLYDLASAFHALWNKGNDDPNARFIIENDPGLTRARLALIKAVQIVIVGGLANLFGVTPQDEMR